MALGSTSIYGITLEAPANTKCHFFRVPPEIRLQIYSCLFKPRCPLESNTSYDNRKKGVYCVSNELYMEENAKEGERKPGNKTDGKDGMHPAILRVNRAIHFEAATLLYT